MAIAKIVLITQYYFPYTKSNAKLMRDLACELVLQGVDVLVVTADESLTSALELSVDDGVKVLRIRCRSFQVESPARRAIAEMLMAFDTWRVARKYFKANPQDLIVWWAPSLFYTFLVAKLKRLWRVKTYLILRDFVPKWWVDCGILEKKSLIYQVFRQIELWQYRTADTVAIQSPANQRYFDEEKLPWVNTELLWNWSRTSGEEIIESRSREQLGLQDKVVFFYGGNIGKAQDMDNIIRLAKNLESETNIHFLFVGDGSEVSRIRSLISSLGLTNFTLLPAVDQKTYLGMLAEYDIGLIALDRNHSTQNFPGKMLNYMYFGIPCLASINPGNDLKELLESREAGLVSITGDDDLLRANALKLALDVKLRKHIGENGRKTLTDVFSVQKAARQLIGKLEVGSRTTSAERT